MLSALTSTTRARVVTVAALLTLLAVPAGCGPGGPTATAAPLGPAATAGGYPAYGQTSSRVRSLQNQLIEAGYLPAELNTGHFASRTRAAVTKVQQAHGLPADGKVDAATAKAVRKAVAAATGPRNWYHREVIGTSAGGRAITAYRTGEPGKPVVMVVATMHGEENFGQYVAEGLLEGRKIGGVDLWVVPVLNPDGLAADRRWVKGGVDLNRNFPNRFVVRANSGPKASSAKETRVVTSFLDRIQPRYLVSWHQPLIGVDTYRVKDAALMNRLAEGLRLSRRSLDCHGSCHGTMTGWYNDNHDGAAITVEYGSTARSMKTMKRRDADAVLTAIGGRRLT